MEHVMQTLMDNVPGGVFACLFDEPLTLLQMNDGFLDMLGYTRSEIHTLFRDSFWNMIDPRDRERTLRETQAQLAKSSTKELEYRMTRRDGTVVWVLDKGRLMRTEDGREAFYCILVDITRSKTLEARLRLSLERHQLILDQANDIIFEWDVATDTLEISPNWYKTFHYQPVTHDISVYLATSPHILPEDRAAFQDITRRVLQGERLLAAEIRLRRDGPGHRWCRLRITGLKDDAGRVVKVVGVIIDIDDAKRRDLALLDRAQRDALTKLLNKSVAQERVEQALRALPEDGCAALMVLDVDDFKGINDTMGHLFGDALLIEVSRTLERQFQAEDVLGRIGGDEFVVFLPRVAGAEEAQTRAGQILSLFGHMAARELTALGAALSCSVGIALAPLHGRNFHDLFLRADRALYQAKAKGKDRYVLYDGVSPLFPSTRDASALGARIDSNENLGASGGLLTEHVFRLLYQSDDLTVALNTILSLVGRTFGVSRAYVYENSEDGRFCCATFEWCGGGDPLPERARRLSYRDDLGGCYQDNFGDDGIFYCRSTADLAPDLAQLLGDWGVKSVLQCAVRDKGSFLGFVGFDECRENRFWTREQTEALTLIAEILSTFLLKQRAQERAQRESQALKTVLDAQNNWVYVVRRGTHELLYANRKSRERIPGIEEGGKCYECCFGTQAPCASCPAAELEQSGGQRTHLIRNPHLDVLCYADVAPIRWKGEDAYLFTCRELDAADGPHTTA